MHAILVAVLLQAGSIDEDAVLAGVGGAAVGTYLLVNTTLMMSDLVDHGYSEPSRLVPSAFFAGGGLLASIVGRVPKTSWN